VAVVVKTLPVVMAFELTFSRMYKVDYQNKVYCFNCYFLARWKGKK